MKRSPSTLRRILVEFAVLVVLHEVALRALASARLMEHLLSPGRSSTWALVATMMFLLLRMFLLVLGPGWLLTRVWLWATRRAPGQARGPGGTA
jgi:hypothetical protein